MLVRSSALLLLGLVLPAPALGDTPVERAPGPASGGASAALALPKLRSLLLHRLPGNALKVPGSPRYLALEDPSERGTRLLVGWVLPGLAEPAFPDLRALTDALAAALCARGARTELPFDASVSLDIDGDAPLVVVELSSERPAATRPLEEALLHVVRGLGAAASAADGATAQNAPGRVATLARAHLSPLSRAVVEVHRRGAPADRPSLPKRYVVQKGDNLAKVARRFGVSEKALVEVNRLDDRRITHGQKLVLPR